MWEWSYKNDDCLNSNDDDLEKVNDDHLYTFDNFDPKNWNVLDSKMIDVLVEKCPKEICQLKRVQKISSKDAFLQSGTIEFYWMEENAKEIG